MIIALIFRDLNASGELVAAPIGKPRSSEKSERAKFWNESFARQIVLTDYRVTCNETGAVQWWYREKDGERINRSPRAEYRSRSAVQIFDMQLFKFPKGEGGTFIS